MYGGFESCAGLLSVMRSSGWSFGLPQGGADRKHFSVKIFKIADAINTRFTHNTTIMHTLVAHFLFSVLRFSAAPLVGVFVYDQRKQAHDGRRVEPLVLETRGRQVHHRSQNVPSNLQTRPLRHDATASNTICPPPAPGRQPLGARNTPSAIIARPVLGEGATNSFGVERAGSFCGACCNVSIRSSSSASGDGGGRVCCSARPLPSA